MTQLTLLGSSFRAGVVAPKGVVADHQQTELGASISGRRDFDDCSLLGIDGLNHLYEIDWEKDENRLEVVVRDNITIPGRGSITDVDKCGSFHGSYLAGDRLRAKLYSCHKPSCPRCHREWASRQGKKSASFLWGIKQYEGDSIYHSVWSPVEGRYTIPQMLSAIKKLMESFNAGGPGVLGYAYVVHPYRLQCLGGHNSPRDRGYSGIKLPPICPDCGMPWHWVYSPHVHLITNFYVDCTSPIKAAAWNQAQSNAGLKYVNISQDNHYYDLTHNKMVVRPGSIESQEVLESIVKYELGHSLVRIGGRQQAIVYVGAWCRLNYDCEWEKHREIAVDDNDVPFRRVHSDGNVVKDKMLIRVVFLSDGSPSWWNDWDNKAVFLYDTYWVCKVTPRRIWCKIHRRYERIDPLKRACSEKLLDYKPLEAYGDYE